MSNIFLTFFVSTHVSHFHLMISHFRFSGNTICWSFPRASGFHWAVTGCTRFCAPTRVSTSPKSFLRYSSTGHWSAFSSVSYQRPSHAASAPVTRFAIYFPALGISVASVRYILYCFQSLDGHHGAITSVTLDEYHILTSSLDCYAMAWSAIGNHKKCLQAFRHPKYVKKMM